MDLNQLKDAASDYAHKALDNVIEWQESLSEEEQLFLRCFCRGFAIGTVGGLVARLIPPLAAPVTLASMGLSIYDGIQQGKKYEEKMMNTTAAEAGLN